MESQILLIDAAPDKTAVLERSLHRRGCRTERVAIGSGDAPAARHAAAVVISEAGETSLGDTISETVQRLVRARVTTLLWGPWREPMLAGEPLVEALPEDTAVDELVGRVVSLSRYAPLVRGMERELQHLQRLGEQLNHYFEEIDQEMRLAGRLQRDFLPRNFPSLPPFTFHALYRPASWVSGDMYDAFRIDESHAGIFIADAMGHGVAAGLLTMFFRQAVVPKRITGDRYTIIPPSEVVSELNTALIKQKLPHCQFITAAYVLLDTLSGEVRLARGGHPYPVLASADQGLREVRSEGGLLGLTDVPVEYEETSVVLGPGDKLVLYTDGLEEHVLLPRVESAEPARFTDAFREIVRSPADQFLDLLEQQLTERAGSLHPSDDITLFVIERSAHGSTS